MPEVSQPEALFTGSDFAPSGTPTPNPTPSPNATPTPSTPNPSPTPSEGPGGRFDERYSGTLNTGEASASIPFQLRRSTLDAQISQNHGNQSIVFELLDAYGNLIATAQGKKISLDGLLVGDYIYRVRGDASRL